MKSARWIWSGILAASVCAMPVFVLAQEAAPAVTAAQAVQPFVGVVTADRVYVRSGPNEKFYELGQLHKGDMVNVVAMQNGWYQITPPKGSYALLAKEFVETDASGTSGTVKADPLNVRAGSVIYPNSDYAVIGKAKKGSRVTILGSNEKYYKVTPPAGSLVYMSPNFVKNAPAGTGYQVPMLTLPGEHVPASPVTPPVPSHPTTMAATAPATMPDGVVIRPPTGVVIEEPATMAAGTLPATRPGVTVAGGDGWVIQPPAATAPATMPATVMTPATKPAEVVVVPVPVPVNTDAYDKFTDLNNRTQAELQKPVLERSLDGLLKEYQDLAAGPKLPGSIQQGCAARVALLTTQIRVQELAKESSSVDGKTVDEQSKALQQQWQDARKRADDLQKNSPPIAEGVLKSSTTVENKYVLVNPTTGRVVAYVDPGSPIDLSRLLGQYVGVHGSYNLDTALGIRVIKVQTATLMAPPGQ